ncbi:hypothetical protein HYV83_03480 [Candidatus Woesearchaeota archaeon]|nr:hypothetical protein [Candidatus Woesearchaeota archaeon]
MLKIIKRHTTEKWEVSLIELQSSRGKKFKVTKRLPELSVAETRMFVTKKKAKKLFDEWLK